MRRAALVGLCRIGVLAAGLFGACAPVSADTLRVGGTGAASAMLPLIFAAYGRDQVDVIPSLGTSGGLRALADGVLDIAVSGRPLKSEESARGLTQAAAIRTPFVLVTSLPQPNGLKSAEIADLYK